MADQVAAVEDGTTATSSSPRLPGVLGGLSRHRVLLTDLLPAAALVVLLITIVQSVVVPRGLHADGAYNLWQVLNERDYVVIGAPRTFAILLNQTPVVLALKLGVRDLDALLAIYSFGVAALPVLFWGIALLVQWRDRFFWPLVVFYGAAFLPSGFIAIGEYNFAFALVAIVLAVLMGTRPMNGWRIGALVFASTALVLCYEGQVFLAIPQIIVALIRIARPGLLGLPKASRRDLVVLSYSIIASLASIAVAGGSMIVRSRNAADSNLAGALNVAYPLEHNLEWRLAAILAFAILLTPLIRWARVRVPIQLLLAATTTALLLDRFHSPIWLHYNTRSLSAMTLAALIGVAVAVAMILNGRSAGRQARAARTVSWPYALPALGVLLGLSVGFWQSTANYGEWLDDLRNVVITHQGPVETTATDLLDGDRAQNSWGWTNPYLSALLQDSPDQGLLISHVETLETFTGVSPAPSQWFSDTYSRD